MLSEALSNEFPGDRADDLGRCSSLTAVPAVADVGAVAGHPPSADQHELLDCLEDVAAVCDRDGVLRFVNRSGRALLPARAEGAASLAELFGPGTSPRVFEEALATAFDQGRWSGEILSGPPGDDTRVIGLTLVATDSADRGRRVLVIGRDVSELRAYEEIRQREAVTDQLTRLPNRAIIFDRLHHALARSTRGGGGIALLFVGLDRFGPVNAEHGHDAGDELLIQTGRRLENAVRSCDTVGRLGGDEFVVLGEPIIRFEDARIIADRVVHAVSDPFELQAGTVRIGASVGMAMSDRDSTPRELARQAGNALRQAKAMALARVVVAE